MSTFKALFEELFGMFVDDGSLAFVILIIVGVAGWMSIRFESHTYVIGAVLYIGCLSALVENVMRTAQKS